MGHAARSGHVRLFRAQVEARGRERGGGDTEKRGGRCPTNSPFGFDGTRVISCPTTQRIGSNSDHIPAADRNRRWNGRGSGETASSVSGTERKRLSGTSGGCPNAECRITEEAGIPRRDAIGPAGYHHIFWLDKVAGETGDCFFANHKA